MGQTLIVSNADFSLNAIQLSESDDQNTEKLGSIVVLSTVAAFGNTSNHTMVYQWRPETTGTITNHDKLRSVISSPRSEMDNPINMSVFGGDTNYATQIEQLYSPIRIPTGTKSIKLVVEDGWYVELHLLTQTQYLSDTGWQSGTYVRDISSYDTTNTKYYMFCAIGRGSSKDQDASVVTDKTIKIYFDNVYYPIAKVERTYEPTV